MAWFSRPNKEGEKPFDPEAIVGPVALAVVRAQLADADSHDSKALGVLGAELAILALGLAARPHWTWFFAPGAGVMIGSIVFLVIDLWPRAYNIGPDIEDLYTAAAASSSARRANQHVIGELVQTFNENRMVATRKGWHMRWGLRLAVVGVVYNTVVFLLVEFVADHDWVVLGHHAVEWISSHV